jgi:hypothetical protein
MPEKDWLTEDLMNERLDLLQACKKDRSELDVKIKLHEKLIKAYELKRIKLEEKIEKIEIPTLTIKSGGGELYRRFKALKKMAERNSKLDSSISELEELSKSMEKYHNEKK